MNDKIIQHDILTFLRSQYGKDEPIITKTEILLTLEYEDDEILANLRYLEGKKWIYSISSSDDPYYDLTTDGMEAIPVLESQIKIESKYPTPNEDSLDFEVENDNFKGVSQVFISHKFVKPDQELAKSLKRQLRKNNIGGYLAEQTREFDIPLNQKIRDKIDESDYLVTIITKHSINSPSVHQEIGYAIGTECPVRIMIETKELPGVLTKDREVEEFTRENFEKKFGIIINDILDKGVRKKVKSQVFQELIQNVYEPCYNQLKNEYDGDEFITTIPPNPWKDKISHRWKLNTEEDIESLFEEYSTEHKIWHEMWIDFANNFQGKEKALGELLKPTFQIFDMIDKDGNLAFGLRELNPAGWIHNCRDVIFNSEIKSGTELYKILKNNSRLQWGERYSKYFDEWNAEIPEIYDAIIEKIPELIKYLDTRFTYQEMDKQRKIIRGLIEKLTESLAEKLQ